MTRSAGAVAVLGLLLCGGADASKRVREPTLQELATVWVGGGPSDLEFLRLDLKSDGSGLLTVQYLPSHPARAYKITTTVVAKYRINFSVEPIDPDAEPIYVGGTAIPSQLTLQIGGTTHDWKRTIELEPLSTLMERIEAVTKRANELMNASQ